METCYVEALVEDDLQNYQLEQHHLATLYMHLTTTPYLSDYNFQPSDPTKNGSQRQNEDASLAEKWYARHIRAFANDLPAWLLEVLQVSAATKSNSEGNKEERRSCLPLLLDRASYGTKLVGLFWRHPPPISTAQAILRELQYHLHEHDDRSGAGVGSNGAGIEPKLPVALRCLGLTLQVICLAACRRC